VGRTNDDSLDGLSVGTLCSTTPVRVWSTLAAVLALEATHAYLIGKQETLQLTIGHHRVEGKQVQLKKPLAILHKSPASGPEGVAYEVVGVIRSKYQCVSHALDGLSAGS
jgi:hypothetical protein